MSVRVVGVILISMQEGFVTDAGHAIGISWGRTTHGA